MGDMKIKVYRVHSYECWVDQDGPSPTWRTMEEIRAKGLAVDESQWLLVNARDIRSGRYTAPDQGALARFWARVVSVLRYWTDSRIDGGAVQRLR
ncbi:hypothetical protein [Amantichitinum ursilacus]|uniref:Uncharacterized protein n=1 Tax=Amantichitinum ursilacus TaxID=857265 RepID=A0A0N1JTE2_9NEIS|nr:hypothetical protein [Amantichitinum ursilacus]KPC54247.1 hypothetical protein WG78_06345 [Amantichitinum ursilacus]